MHLGRISLTNVWQLQLCVGEVDDSPPDWAQTTGCILVSPHIPALGSGEVILMTYIYILMTITCLHCEYMYAETHTDTVQAPQ